MAEYTGTFERKEVKYRLNLVQVRMIKQALGAYMAPDEYGQTSITSVYYDTRNRDMISRSLEKPAYKEKLRLRTYGPRSAQAPVFVELKKKHKGIVYKRRITPPEDAAGEFIAGRAPLCEHPPQSSQQPQRKTAAAAVCRKSLAEFAPAGANKVQSIFASRLANVRA